MSKDGIRSRFFAAPFAMLLCMLWPAGQVNAQMLPSPARAAGPVINFEYDAAGNLTKTVVAPGVPALNLPTTHAYDPLSRRKTTTDAGAGVTQFGYDGLDRLTLVRDPRLLGTQYMLNGLGDRTALVSPDTGTSAFTYDAAGNIKTGTDGRGMQSSFSYDALNRLTSWLVINPASTSSRDRDARSFTWIYDQTGDAFGFAIGRLTTANSPEVATTFKYDRSGRLLQAQTTGRNTAQPPMTIKYAYDLAGRVERVVYPSGRVATYNYVDGQPVSVSIAADENAKPQTLVSQIEMSPFGPAKSWNWELATGAASHQREFDNSGRMVRYPMGSLVRDLSYDAADRITAYTHYMASTGTPQPAFDQSFGYNALNRLSSVTTSSGNLSFAYDANGNRTQTSSASVTRNYTVASNSNRLNGLSNPTRSLAYDDAGNTTSNLTAGQPGSNYSATYSTDGRLASLSRGAGNFSVAANFSYDAMGQRVRRWGQGTNALYAYDQAGNLLGEYGVSAAQTLVPTLEYVWFDGAPIAALRSVLPPSLGTPVAQDEVFFIHTDHLGAPRIAVDTQNRLRWRWMAEPFGLTPAEPDPSGLGAPLNITLRLPGQQFDGFVGLHYNYFRDYDPTTGRYVQSDPIGLDGGINTYAYVGSQSTKYSDSQGLWSTEAHNYFIDTFFPGLPQSARDLIKQGSEYADSPLYQDAAHSFMHAMSSAAMDKTRAKQLFCRFLKEKMALYGRDLGRPRGIRNAYVSLGMALHAVMDSTSPVHRGFQKWDSSQIEFHGPHKFGPIDRPNTREDIDVAPHYADQTHRRMRDLMSGQLLADCDCQ